MDAVNGISNVVSPVDVTTLTAEEQAALLAVQEQETTTPGGALGKDEFLNLLVTQLSNQDPLDPMDSTESIAQLAQFSALEQMQNVGNQIASLRQASGMTDAMLIQGQTVEAVDANGATYAGVVDSAVWGSDGLILTINGTEVSMSNIVELKLTQLQSEETETETETEMDESILSSATEEDTEDSTSTETESSTQTVEAT